MRISICSQYIQKQRNYTSCGTKWYGWNAQYSRMNVWPMSIWFENSRGLSIGADPAYWKSYKDCPTMFIRICRWIGYKTGAYPSTSRPYPEYPRTH